MYSELTKQEVRDILNNDEGFVIRGKLECYEAKCDSVIDNKECYTFYFKDLELNRLFASYGEITYTKCYSTSLEKSYITNNYDFSELTEVFREEKTITVYTDVDNTEAVKQAKEKSFEDFKDNVDKLTPSQVTELIDSLKKKNKVVIPFFWNIEDVCREIDERNDDKEHHFIDEDEYEEDSSCDYEYTSSYRIEHEPKVEALVEKTIGILNNCYCFDADCFQEPFNTETRDFNKDLERIDNNRY